MIGIIGAMTEEIEIIKSTITDVKEKVISNIKFYQGSIHDKSVVLMQSGIGKVNASMSTTVLFEHFEIHYVINIGTAGGVKTNCEVLDIIISDKVSYHDVDVTAFNYEFGQVPQLPQYYYSDQKLIEASVDVFQKENLPYHQGLIVSGDSFINNEKQISEIIGHFHDVVAVEMEACAIAQVSYLYQKPFIIIRSLSDIAGKQSSLSFEQYLKSAAHNSSTYVLKLIEKISGV